MLRIHAFPIVLNGRSGLRPSDGEPVNYFFFGVASDDQKTLWKGSGPSGTYQASPLMRWLSGISVAPVANFFFGLPVALFTRLKHAKGHVFG